MGIRTKCKYIENYKKMGCCALNSDLYNNKNVESQQTAAPRSNLDILAL